MSAPAEPLVPAHPHTPGAAPALVRRVAPACVAGLAILALWQGVVWVAAPPAFILPGPLAVVRALAGNARLIAGHGLATLWEVLAGLVLGAGLGAATAVGLAFSRRARVLAMPLLVLSQAVPVFALAPLLTLWFGYGMLPKVAMAVLIVYFPVASAFLDGLLRTDPGWLDLARTMRARPGRVMWHLRIPAALPSLASGLRLAAVYAPIGAVIGEWVGASRGLGYLMLLANGRARIDLMFAALFVLVVLTLATRLAVGLLCRRLD
ncbi:ABC transporter permease (plasmid) [Paroceanicella profunda]|uniref:ABC transporter permease n=1 Tax=Paroceanicella profunda TaxID=2579971 RepID=A0A5B8G3F0_9RHOB|nr:ABC transporter permease [Paroceanicella profunda]QDL93822.1 ABC transporter permease [Paroceanicella profunda]